VDRSLSNILIAFVFSTTDLDIIAIACVSLCKHEFSWLT
jgi:hypothetical protein